jgi:uncharacterized protein (TIGR02246 family)
MSMRRTCLVTLAVVTAACSSNAPSADRGSTSVSQDTAGVGAAIHAANARFLEAFKRGDKAGLVANYADDAILMMPNEEAWRGRDGLDRGFSGFLSQMSFKDGSATTADLMLAGDLAVETGTFAWTLQPKAGPEIKDKGKYLTVWKRQQDGTWKIVRDINNTDLPASK